MEDICVFEKKNPLKLLIYFSVPRTEYLGKNSVMFFIWWWYKYFLFIWL